MDPSISAAEFKLITTTKQFLTTLGADRLQREVSLDAYFDRDLGLGSLEKVELFHRIESEFGVQFSDKLLTSATTLKHLLAAIRIINPQQQSLFQSVEILKSSEVDVSKANTLIEVLQKYAQAEPNRPHIYLLDETGAETNISYGGLSMAATAVAQGLRTQGLQAGETVAIMLPTGEDFFYAFFGILLAGGIPVPIYPPVRPEQIEEYARREAKILSNAEVRVLITFQDATLLSKILQTFIPSLKEVTTIEALRKIVPKAEIIKLLSELIFTTNDLAFIQYTSGSTSDPKGVMLTHANLLANLRAVGQAINITSADRVVSWLPLYHDMGLIGTWLGSLYFGITVTIMSPLFFLNRPERWLWAMHYYRATLSAGPNFAYELCARKISDEAVEGLDLSAWRIAFNGAEAVYPKTLDLFSKRFAKYGFKSETIYPVYGLAESSVALSFPPLGRVPRIDAVDREIFSLEQRAVPVAVSKKQSLQFVSCGRPLPGHSIRIVDDTDQEVPERTVGNLQFQGPSSMQGYYRNTVATQAAYHQGWWDSGDLAYCADGEIFITGRKKDLIIKTGRNLHAAELEEITNQIAGVRKGCVVAFGITDHKAGTEKLIIVAETNEKKTEPRQNLITEITQKIFAEVGLPPDEVVLVSPKTIPKTSSGKLRRSDCKQKYLHGKLQHKTIPIWLQVSHLFLAGIGKKIIRGITYLGRALYTLYVSLISIIILLPLWFAILFLPRKKATRLCQQSAYYLLKLACCPLKVSGQEKLIDNQAMVYVVNHASYIDALVLMAILPLDVAFVAKQELLQAPIIKTFLKKLAVVTVDRADFTQSIADTEFIEQGLLQQNRSIAIFPEGTFGYATGLRPFKLGAFKVAVDTQRPICPIALCGTRNILRDSNWLLRPGKIIVTVGEKLIAKDKDWSEMIRLRTAARLEIAKYCGESLI